MQVSHRIPNFHYFPAGSISETSTQTSVGLFPCQISAGSLRFRQEFARVVPRLWNSLRVWCLGTPSPFRPARQHWPSGIVPGTVAEVSPSLPGSSRLGFHGAGGARVPLAERAHLPAHSAPGLKTRAGRGREGTRETAPLGRGWAGDPEKGRRKRKVEWRLEKLKEESGVQTAGRTVCPERGDKRKPGGSRAEREAQDRTDMALQDDLWAAARPGGCSHC